MPADLASRRPSRKLSTDDDIDIRRSRGEISCAECRRLKLKCDKKIPCGSCTRRGCHSICPNGSWPSSQGTSSKPASADTSQSQAKEMGKRIQQLEDALAIFQSSASNEPHPLLRDDLLSINRFPKITRKLAKEDIRDITAENIDALGILTIGDHGAKYYGPSAGSEALFMAGAEMDMSALELEQTSRVSPEITGLSRFHFGADQPSGVILELLLDHLPPQPRAWSLYETYMEHCSWIFRPVKREEMIDEIMTPIYKIIKDGKINGSRVIESISPHKLAVLFLTFSLGAFLDLTLEPYNTESETYYHLGSACLSLRSVFDSPEIATVQAVVMMAFCHAEGGIKHTLDSAWALMSLGAKLAQSIGLHRDGARFGMDAKTLEYRRCLFWELFSIETLYSIALGRPPSIRTSYIDCEFPENDTQNTDGSYVSVGFYRWKYEFMRDIFAQVAEHTLAGKAPQYQVILELDRKLRGKTLPPHLQNVLDSLMYIHKSFFAQAILDHPDNPMRSAFAPSFLAAYRSASSMIKYVLCHFERFPDLCSRVWSAWTTLFPAAIIVGCIVMRSPSSSMAANAFIELGIVYDLFEKGANQSRRARDGLAILTKLKEKAYQVYSQYRTGDPSSEDPGKTDELCALFGGQTRVIVSKLLSSRSPKGTPTQHTSGSSAQRSSESDPTLVSNETSVPAPLMEYVSMFPTTDSSNISQSPVCDRPPLFDQKLDSTAFSTFNQQDYGAQNIQNTQFSWPSPSQNITPPPNYSKHSFPAPYSPFVPQAQHETAQLKSDFHSGNFFDLGMMMASDSHIDEQWASFVRDTGPLMGHMGSYDVNGTAE